MRAYREISMEIPDLVKTNPQDLKDSIKSYPKETKGVDNFTKTDLKNLPDFSISELNDNLNLSRAKTALTYQSLLSLNPCLGKPNGTCRTICKTAMLYRMMCRMDNTVKQWEAHVRQPFDSAGKGSSALESALIRNILAELAH